MKQNELLEKVRSHPRPVVIEFWAPWCMPCKRMAPDLERISREYKDRVDLWRFNADEHPDLLRELGILGIPTLLVFSGDKQIDRRTGAQNLTTLQEIFAAGLAGLPAPHSLAATERLLRAGSGMTLTALALFVGSSAWPLFIVAGLLIFSAVYDRCPIYQAIFPRIKSFFSR